MGKDLRDFEFMINQAGKARRLKIWWRVLRYRRYCRKHHICPTHLVLQELRDHLYSTEWVCRQCEIENHTKHEHRVKYKHLERVAACNALRKKAGLDW